MHKTNGIGSKAVMQDAAAIQGIESRYAALATLMDERMRRQWAAAEARSYVWGGVRAVSRATRLSPNTISKGLVELEAREANPFAVPESRLRKPGAGRKRATVSDPGLAAALERLVDPVTRGDPQSPLRWTCKSTTQLARELTREGHPVSPRTVGRLLKSSGYSLQGNRKTKESAAHPDRNAQFEHINAMVFDFQKRGQPVISVDTKKKELVGEFRNSGREWQRKGNQCKYWSTIFGQAVGQGHPLRRLRSHGEPRLGQRRDRPRHGALRCGGDSPLVEENGIEAPRWCNRVAHHGRRWRQQRKPLPIVESGPARPRRSVGDPGSCLSLPAGHQ